MKKMFITVFFLSFFFFINTSKNVRAAVACPTDNISCTILETSGGCASPCIEKVSGGGKGPSFCSCIIDTLPTGSVACGGDCNQNANCGSDCPFCRANGPGTPQTCSTFKTSDSGLPEVFCVLNNPDVRTSSPQSGKIASAIGCIPSLSAQELANFLFKWGSGFAGGIALIMTVIGGYMVTTSAGDPRKLQAGKDLISAALSGLVFLIASAFFIKVIGVDILNIPGL